jgi:hypothetical protein
MTRYLGRSGPQQISDGFEARVLAPQSGDRIHDRCFIGSYIQCKLIADFRISPRKIPTAGSHHNHRLFSDKFTSASFPSQLHAARVLTVLGMVSDRQNRKQSNKTNFNRKTSRLPKSPDPVAQIALWRRSSKHMQEPWLTMITASGAGSSSCRYGKFGKTKAYELIGHERIRAYKMGGETMIDLDSVDEYHASLPRVERRAS